MDAWRFRLESEHTVLNIAHALKNETDMALLISGGNEKGEKKSILCLFPEDEKAITEKRGCIKDLKDFLSKVNGFPTVGYFSYELGRLTQRYRWRKKPLMMPLASIRRYKVYIEEDLEEKSITVFGEKPWVSDVIDAITKKIKPCEPPSPKVSQDLTRSMSRDEYIEKVKKTVEYIKDGEIYQLNLSMEFSVDMEGDGLDLTHMLLTGEPASFYAYIKEGNLEIISTSPERFIRVIDGKVLSQPIKGTKKFSHQTKEKDLEELLTSEKEDAELSMIVDLIRNDISINCIPGTVKVPRHKRVKEAGRLFQMYSDVTGTLKPEKTCWDLFLDAFPGGSITGCPKIRAMEIIDGLEPHARNIYCGSIAIIVDEKNMDSSIAIRTAILKDGRLRFYAGSGIVADSKAENEYEETVSKAEKFLRLVGKW